MHQTRHGSDEASPSISAPPFVDRAARWERFWFERWGPDTVYIHNQLIQESKMAKPNYSYEKRQKELAKKKKQEEKRKRKQAAKDESPTEEQKSSE
jgi:hypothetical protein